MSVRTNLSGFYSKYTNIQRSTFGVSDTGQTYIGISNGPKATTYGLQLEATIQPAAGLLLNANYGYLQTKYDEGSPGFPKGNAFAQAPKHTVNRSEEHTSELQSLMRISYAVFCWKKKKNQQQEHTSRH